MSMEENLTYLQKVALKGEIAYTVSTSAHDAEIKFRTYLILKEVSNKYRPLVVECIKEAVTFDESIIDRIYLDVIYNNTPDWLWVDEIISDIKLYTSIPDTSYATGIKLSINKLKERKNIIESAFILFARKALLISHSSVEKLLDKILDDYDLEFLHSACFYLKNGCSEIRCIKGDIKEVPEELMSCLFDVKKLLSFTIETDSLKEDFTNKGHAEEVTSGIIHGSIVLPIPEDFPKSNEEVSKYISEKIAELFEGKISKPSPSKTVYVVKKVYIGSGLSTDIRICKTEEEARNFVEKVVKEYPELTKTCEFQIHMEKINGKEKGTERS
jgi:hypothetical protein